MCFKRTTPTALVITTRDGDWFHKFGGASAGSEKARTTWSKKVIEFAKPAFDGLWEIPEERIKIRPVLNSRRPYKIPFVHRNETAAVHTLSEGFYDAIVVTTKPFLGLNPQSYGVGRRGTIYWKRTLNTGAPLFPREDLWIPLTWPDPFKGLMESDLTTTMLMDLVAALKQGIARAAAAKEEAEAAEEQPHE